MGWTASSGSAAPSTAGVVPSGAADADAPENIESMSIQQLMEFLRSSFHKPDFEMAASALVSREECLKAALEARFSEELMVRKVEKVELEARVEGLVRELDYLRSRCSDLEQRVLQDEGEMDGARSVEEKDMDGESSQKQIPLSEGACVDLSEQEKKAQGKNTALLDSGERQGDADFWRQKCKDLEAKVRSLENENSSLRRVRSARVDGKAEEKYCPVPKLQVDCNADDSPLNDYDKPSLTGVIEISDSEDEMTEKDRVLKELPKVKFLDRKADLNSEANTNLMHSVNCQNLIEHKDDVGSNVHSSLSIPTPKRRRVSRVITSDSEGENDDDSIPIGNLRRCEKAVGEKYESDDNLEEITPSKRRLVTLRERCRLQEEIKENSPRYPSTPSIRNSSTRINPPVFRKLKYSDNDDDGSNKGEVENDDVSDSEGESLDGFIVNGSDNSASECSLYDSSVHTSEEVNSDADLDGVFSDLRCEKDNKHWEYEADMLSAFSRDPELCLKAVCAIYRQQTSCEKSAKEAILNNKRGFSKFDAPRGSMIAEFLMDGDPHGPLQKSVEELETYARGGPEYCHKLANRYSKQLFTIYQNKEDPFFCPSKDQC